MWIITVVIGLISVLTGVLILKTELSHAIQMIPKQEHSEVLRSDLDELNSSFFEIANDLEGKYSIHEKQIRDIETVLNDYTKRQIQNRYGKKGVATAESRSVSKSEPKFERKSEPKSLSKHELQYESKSASDQDAEEMILYENISREVILKSRAEDLLHEGYRLPEIAKKLEVGIGELSLLLGMKRDIR